MPPDDTDPIPISAAYLRLAGEPRLLYQAWGLHPDRRPAEVSLAALAGLKTAGIPAALRDLTAHGLTQPTVEGVELTDDAREHARQLSRGPIRNQAMSYRAIRVTRARLDAAATALRNGDTTSSQPHGAGPLRWLDDAHNPLMHLIVLGARSGARVQAGAFELAMSTAPLLAHRDRTQCWRTATDAALAIARTLDRPDFRMRALISTADRLRSTSEPCETALHEALAIARNLGDRRHSALINHRLGTVTRVPRQARHYFCAALATQRALRLDRACAHTLLDSARSYIAQQRSEEAVPLLREARRLLARDPEWELEARLSLCEVLVESEQGSQPQAMSIVTRVLGEADAMGSRTVHHHARLALARIAGSEPLPLPF